MQTILLSDIGQVVTGKTPQKAYPEYWGEALDFITPTDFKDSKYIDPARKLSEAGREAMHRIICSQNSVIVTCIGSDMGKVALAKKPFVSNQQINTLVINEEKANPDFIYYLLKFNRPLLRKYAESGGSTMPIINKSTFERLSFDIPDLESQKEIANILGTIDEKIELNRKMNETLEEMGQALFRHYFIDNPEAEKWGSITLGSKIKPRRGKSLQSKNMKPGIVPVVSGGLQPAGLHNEANTTSPVITVSASGANAGYTALWGQDVWSADSSFIDSTVTSDVYFYYLLLSRNQRRIYGMQTGAAQPHIYPSHLELIEMPNAPDEIIARFNDEVESYFLKIEENKKQIQTLTTLHDTLLPRLISGKVEV